MSSALPRFLFPLVLGIGLAGYAGGAAQANGRLFVIPETDGYGVSECLAQAGACGKIVADSWCSAHGQGAALAWGKAEDITASISDSEAKSVRTVGALVVRCGA